MLDEEEEGVVDVGVVVFGKEVIEEMEFKLVLLLELELLVTVVVFGNEVIELLLLLVVIEVVVVVFGKEVMDTLDEIGVVLLLCSLL